MIEDIKAWLKRAPNTLENRLDPEAYRARAEEAEQEQRRAAAERQAVLARARAEFDAGAGERALRLIYSDEICDEIIADHNRSMTLSKIIAEISAEYVQVLKDYKSQVERHEQNSTSSLALEAAVSASSIAFHETSDRSLPLDKLWPWTNREFESRGLRADLVAAGALTLLAIESLDQG
ncbi:MAG: hypothetical protein WDN69_16340 [Aliidongia sp.]